MAPPATPGLRYATGIKKIWGGIKTLSGLAVTHSVVTGLKVPMMSEQFLYGSLRVIHDTQYSYTWIT